MISPDRAVTPVRAQLTTFLNALLPESLQTGRLLLRSFPDGTGRADPASPGVRSRSIKLAMPRAELIDAIFQEMITAANAPTPMVFCPPVCVFTEGSTRGREEDMLAGLALVVDLDANPGDGLQTLTETLGPATLVVASGGLFQGPSGPEPKLHAYWVLREPATGASLTTLKEARRMARALSGGDHTNVPLVHPIRWPGSVHRKDPKNPKLCRIVNRPEDHTRRYSLEQLHATLRAALPADHAAATELTGPGQRVDERSTAEIARSLAAGEGLHPNLVPLAMRLAVSGTPENMTLELLRGMMLAQPVQDDRWRQRFEDVTRTVRTAYARLQFEADPAWVNALRGPRNTITGDWFTIHRAIRTAPPLRNVFRWDLRAGRVEVSGATPWDPQWTQPRALTDTDITSLCVYLNAAGIPLEGDGIVLKVLTAHAKTMSYDPVTAYLDGLIWDRTPRIHNWLTRYCGAQITEPFSAEYVSQVGAKWLLQCVARGFRPGCKADCVLILEGEQGAYKSEVFKILGGPWFSDRMGDLSGDYKTAAELIQGHWIIEIAELDAVRKADVSRIKDFLTKQEDFYRTPYGRIPEARPRRCSFGGTINPTGDYTYLQDPSGNRRFWPIYCNGVYSGQIDRRGLQDVRDQLWAEAVHLFRADEQWWFDRDLERALVAPVQEARAQDETWIGAVDAWIARENADGALARTGFTVSDVLTGALGIPLERHTKAAQTRAGIALQAITTWTGRRRMADGRRERRYVPTDQAGPSLQDLDV